MKKKAFAILTLCISLFAAVALVGCGGSGDATGSGGGGGAEKPAVDMRTDFIWFKVEVPEGVEITDVAGDTADRAQFKFTESEHASDASSPSSILTRTPTSCSTTRQSGMPALSGPRMTPSSTTARLGATLPIHTRAA